MEKKQEKLAIAREFKKLGVAITDISKGTGLPIEVIEKLYSIFHPIKYQASF